MGMTSRPRSPAIHRAAQLLDAVWSDRARTPASLVDTLGLAKSSVFDLLSSLETESLVARSVDGQLSPGARWAALADPTRVADRLLRGCTRVHDLDGHTVSVVRLVGSRALFVDVRVGQFPLPLTPRPGQYSAAADSAGAVAILCSMTEDAAAEAVSRFAAFEGLGTEDFAGLLVLRRSHLRVGAAPPGSTVVLGHQLAGTAPGSQAALTVHLPQPLPSEDVIRRLSEALTVVVADLVAS